MKDSESMGDEKRRLSVLEVDSQSCDSGEEVDTSPARRNRNRSGSVSKNPSSNNNSDENKPKRGRGRPPKCLGKESSKDRDLSNSASSAGDGSDSVLSIRSRSHSNQRLARKRGRPKGTDNSLKLSKSSYGNEGSVRRRSRNQSDNTARPKRNLKKPKKLFFDSSCSESSEMSTNEDEGSESSPSKEHSSQDCIVDSSNVDTKNCVGKGSNSNRSSLKKEKESNNESNTVIKKRKLSVDGGRKITGDKDVFCWQCHRDSNNMITCHGCPRAFHKRCAKVQVETENWICVECNSAMIAGSYLNQSEVRSLSQDELNQLFKFIMERVYNHEGAKYFKCPVDLVEYPNYKDYVIHPMDLLLIEKNINNSVYKTTESFVADMKWLVHNSYIFNSVYSELTAFARGILKIVKQEAEEIDNCPHCYFHYHTMDDDTWFIEPCKKPHLLVWAKLRGFPHWPAKVMRTVNDLVDVRFFGDHNRSWLSPDLCYLFSKSSPFPNKMGDQAGYSDCLKEVFIHIKKLQVKFSGFNFSPPRVKYVPENHEQMLLEMLPMMNSNNAGESGPVEKKLPPVASPLKSLNGVSKKATPLASKLRTETSVPSYVQEDLGAVSLLNKSSAMTRDKSSDLNDIHQKSDEVKVKEEIIDGDSDSEHCDISEIPVEYCYKKKAQVVLTRIHFEGKLNKEALDSSCSSNQPSYTPSPEKDLKIQECDKILGNDCIAGGRNNDASSKTDFSSTKKHDPVSDASSKVMLKLKPCAELLSSEALKNHNANSKSFNESCIQSRSLASVKETTVKSCLSEVRAGPDVESKVRDTIEKVVQDNFKANASVVKPNTNLIPELSKSDNRPSQSQQQDEGNSESEDSDDCLSIESVLKIEVEDREVSPSNIIPDNELNDVGVWLNEKDTGKLSMFNSVLEGLSKCEHSQNLDDCKRALLELKRLVVLQTQTVIHYTDKIKNDAKEVYEVFLSENKKLVKKKKLLYDNMRHLKLNQWCNFCLKEACFYCCWGTSYCSKICQHNDWNVHFKNCKQADNDNGVGETVKNVNLPPSVSINKVSATSKSGQITIMKAYNKQQSGIVKIPQIKSEPILKNSLIKCPKILSNIGSSKQSNSPIGPLKPVLVMSNNKNHSVFKVSSSAFQNNPRVVQILSDSNTKLDGQNVFITKSLVECVKDKPNENGPLSSKSNLLLSNGNVKLVQNNSSPILLRKLPSVSPTLSKNKGPFVLVTSPNRTNKKSISSIELPTVSPAS